MVEVKPFDPLWEEDNILICVTLPAPLGKQGCYTVMNWCQKGPDKFDVKRIVDELMESRDSAMARAKALCEEHGIPILYDADFHKDDFLAIGKEIEEAQKAQQAQQGG
ncbi:MAG: hypothetical protein NXI16_14390 [Alphaproteobacteria bacterium]|nr:hypothetical protein [Alphaproteobacteria bacterium]